MTEGGPCTPWSSGCDVVLRKKSVAFQGGMTWDRHSSSGLTWQVWGAVSEEGHRRRGHCGSPMGLDGTGLNQEAAVRRGATLRMFETVQQDLVGGWIWRKTIDPFDWEIFLRVPCCPSQAINKHAKSSHSSQTSNFWARKCLKWFIEKIPEMAMTACEMGYCSIHHPSLDCLSFALLVKSWFPILIHW